MLIELEVGNGKKNSKCFCDNDEHTQAYTLDLRPIEMCQKSTRDRQSDVHD